MRQDRSRERVLTSKEGGGEVVKGTVQIVKVRRSHPVTKEGSRLNRRGTVLKLRTHYSLRVHPF